MNVIYSNTLAGRRRRPLAVCLASIFSLSSPATAFAATNWPVTSCNESGAGSIRDVIGAGTTLSGDTVDLSGLTACPSSKISLTTGEIFVSQASLTIKGPGASVLTIDASGNPYGTTGPFNSRVFTHTGSGTLEVEYLTLTGGHSIHTAYLALGGCIYSASNVTLLHAGVRGCYTYEYGSYDSRGGGVYTKGNLNVKYSTIGFNHANAFSTVGRGGGAYVKGGIFTKYSTISGNTAVSSAGGISVSGNATILASTISGNSAALVAGIEAFSSTPAGNKFQLGNSTVSGNTATSAIGGMYVNSGTTYFYNSTIAFNNAPTVAGVELNSNDAAIAVELQSTLMSNNSNGSSDFDFYVVDGINAITINGGNVVTPANNLIRASNATLPSDTRVSCPQLGPLRDNGGLTQTHALGSTSSAIDRGNTVGTGGGAGNYDQRGSATANGVMNYVRESGPIGDIDPPVADIGAYEVQQDDVIFQTFFDGCNTLI